MPDAFIELFTIYDHPLDCPDLYIARLFRNDQPTGVTWTSPDLEALRRMFTEQGLYCIPRADDDDPVIVETWL